MRQNNENNTKRRLDMTQVEHNPGNLRTEGGAGDRPLNPVSLVYRESEPLSGVLSTHLLGSQDTGLFYFLPYLS